MPDNTPIDQIYENLGMGFSDSIKTLTSSSFYGTHYSHLGVGGFVEMPTLQDMHDIPWTSLNTNGFSTGRRKLGMIVYVIEQNKYYQLLPRERKPDIKTGSLGSPVTLSEWSSFSDAKKVCLLAPRASADDVFEDDYGFLSESSMVESDAWTEVFVKDGFNTLNDLNIFASGNVAAYPGQICSVVDTNKIYLIASGVAGLSAQEVNTGGGAGGAELFTEDITLSLSNGKTFGKYLNGNTIFASGKSANQVIKEACFEALEPTVTLTTSSTIPFGETNPSISLNFAYTINSFGAQVSGVELETKRNNETTWNVVGGFNKNTISPFTHAFAQTQYNTQKVNYQITVTDTAGGAKTVPLDVTPTPYAIPTLSSVNVGSATRYKGDTTTSYQATMTKASPLISISSYKLQRSLDSGGNWSDVAGSNTLVSTNPVTINIPEDSAMAAHSSLKNASTIQYRIVVTDSYQTSNLSASTITFVHKRGIVYKSAGSFALATQALTLNDIDTAPNLSLSDIRGSIINGVTAALGVYVYYVYKSTLGDLTNVTQLPSSEVLGSFTKILNISGTNSNGATVSYIVYVTNSDGAFTGTNLQFI